MFGYVSIDFERSIDKLPLILTTTQDLTRNLGICPDQESNGKPFFVQDDTSTNWARAGVYLI